MAVSLEPSDFAEATAPAKAPRPVVLSAVTATSRAWIRAVVSMAATAVSLASVPVVLRPLRPEVSPAGRPVLRVVGTDPSEKSAG